MPFCEAPSFELGNAPRTPSLTASPSSSEISSTSSPEPPYIRATPLFRALAIRPPEPEQPPGQDELERRLPGYRRIVIPRELTLIELLKQNSGVTTDDEVLHIREAKLRVIADRVGLRRLHILAPRLRELTLDGSAIASLRDLGVGMVHLKILSIRRCNLTSLDGVWGLGSLRELNAAGNRLQDLQPLAALQKLQTLDLSDNPISESSRIWTLGVCGALRKLSLNGTPASSVPDYRSRVAAALPMLVYLDERPLHTDIDFEYDEELSSASSNSDVEVDITAINLGGTERSVDEAEPGPSTQPMETVSFIAYSQEENEVQKMSPRRLLRRPATTENAGVRPTRPTFPRRPRTAQDRPNIDEPTRLQILHTLMDDEWLASGSKLTSMDAVCGNLARAMRRTSSAYKKYHKAEKEEMEYSMENASRAAAAEIPRAPTLEDWVKFKEDTGIEIDVDICSRPKCLDPSKCLDRLEQIEKETQERLKEESRSGASTSAETSYGLSNSGLSSTMNDSKLWTLSGSVETGSINPKSDLDMFFDDVSELH